MDQELMEQEIAEVPQIRKDAARADRGAASVFLVVALTMIVIVALLFMVPFGSAVLDRRTASTAADAAALGAAARWVEGLEETHNSLLAAESEAEFWGLLGRSLGAYRKPGMQAEATRFSSANDSRLLSYSVDTVRGRVDVRVRSAEPAVGTDEYVYSEATSELVLERGLCLTGGRVGVRLSGLCRISAPPSPPAPSPSPSPTDEDGEPIEPEPTPSPTFELPSGLDTEFGVRTRLVGS